MEVRARPSLPKAPTGIQGLDEITGGGLPRGRTTLICGGPGSGKTLMAVQFLVRGATDFGEPGVLMVFEETAQDVTENVASLGFELDRMVAEGKIHIDHVRVQRHEIEETGEYDLEGLFVRLAHAIKKVGAQRVAIDTIETLFAGFDNPAILRSELKRLFHWLKAQGVTAVITGERGESSLTRQGLEEYVSDCVMVLDHRVTSEVSTRRLRIVKYRGSTHGTNEYPFLIDDHGFTVVPITSAHLDHDVSTERVSTGIPGLDEMLEGKGVHRGSTVLITGTAGTGKTTTCAHFAAAACARGERTLYFAFEESRSQVLRNMRSVGIDLSPHVASGLLQFHAARPSLHGLEAHLAHVMRAVEEFDPRVVILDPMTAMLGTAASAEVQALATRLVDGLKAAGITAVFTGLLRMGSDSLEETELGISSLVDTWLLVRDIELNGERNRALYILKSRGTAHSNQVREFVLTSSGVELRPAYLGPEGVLTGSSRVQQEARARAAEVERQQEIKRLRRQLEHKRVGVETQIAALRAEIESEEAEFEATVSEEASRRSRREVAERELAESRRTDPSDGTP